MNVSTMSNFELYSAVAGTKSYRIADITENTLYAMESTEELSQLYGLTERQSEKLLCSVELAKRIASKRTGDLLRVNNPDEVAKYLMPLLRFKKQEEFWVVCLNTKNKIISAKALFKGTLSGTTVHPREIFKYAVINSAASIIVAHNHPSGEPSPSPEDSALTKRIDSAGKLMGIPLLDHMIIGDGVYYSFKDERTAQL